MAINKKRPNVLLLLWHSNDSVAGGFVRVKEFIKYFGDIDLTIIDNYPNLLKEKEYKNVHIIPYTTPYLIIKIYSLSYSFGRIFEWIYALIMLVFLGIIELRKGKYQVIYGPTGDNLHIFMSGVILKILFPQKKLLLDVLNLEMPEGSIRQYYSTFRDKKVGIIETFLKTYSLAFLLFVEKIMINKCDYVVTVSPYMKKVISEFYPAKNIDYTQSGVSTPKNFKKYEQNIKIYDGIYVGRHTKDKGIFDIIQVWSKVLQKNKKAKLITLGSCPKETREQLSATIKSYNGIDNIIIQGLVSEEMKWRNLGRSRVFLHLAYFEPLVPVITILEALAFGIPVIMYDVNAIDDYPFLRENPAIIIVKNRSITEVTNKMIVLLNKSEKEMIEIKKAAKKLAKKFSWEKAAEKELKIIHRLAHYM